MSGQPAARQGDATLLGGPIVQGSASVLIGAPSGVACSVCPGGMTKGNPVNPALGAKVFPGETDVSLPGPAALIINRSYNSYQTPTPGPVGLFGPGWKGASDVSLQVRPQAVILNDNGGRSLRFDPLSPGEIVYSRSEKLWLARGGVEALADKRHALATLWQTLAQEQRENNHLYFVANSPQGPWWVLGYTKTVPAADAVLPQPLPVHRPLLGISERGGQQLQYLRDTDGEFAGAVTGAIDGAGRRFRLELMTIALPTLTRPTGYGQDDGIRLSAVYLVSAPGFADIPDTPLVRYEYTDKGELAAVYDRANHQVRQFGWDPDHPGRMLAHRYAGRPVTTYEYNADGKVITQRNPGGLDYHFAYEKDRTTVTDSLNRTEIYHFTGEGGLRRPVMHIRADGSCTRSEYDEAGRLIASVDALCRKTEFDMDVANGNLCGLTTPGGRQTRYSYNNQHQLVRTIYPDRSEKTRAYDDTGRMVAQTDALKQTTRYHYAGDTDQVIAVEPPDGGRQTLEWTRYGQLACYTDCSGHRTEYEYDLWGQLVHIRLEEGLSSTRHYDARGRLTATESATGDTTQYHYNEAGDRVRITFPDGRYEETEYDPQGHPQRYIQANGTLIQQFSHDTAGRLTEITNENGARTTFAYDVMDRQVQETGFDGRLKSWQFNPAGELIYSDDCGLGTHWYYDIAGRLIRRERPPLADGTPDEEHRIYTDNGQLKAVEHLSAGHRVSARWQHDRTGRMIAERQQVIAPDGNTLWEHTIGHHYQARGGLAQTLPDGLPAIDWLTYGPGHLLGVALDGKPLLEFERDRLHREHHRHFGAHQLDTLYQKDGRLAGLTLTGNPASALNREYSYDTRGQITTIRTGPDDARHFIYDDAGRLREELGLYPAHYQYDPAGNRLPGSRYDDPISLARRDPRDMARPALPDNRITEDETFIYRYDVYGNLVEKRCHGNESEVHHFTWDSQHRLSQYSHTLSWSDGHDTTRAEYLYDALGRRIGKRTVVLNSQGHPREEPRMTWYGWEGDNLVLTERDGQRIHTVYQPGSFVPLLRIEGDIPEPVQTLADTLTQDSGITFPPEVTQQLHQLEQELRDGELSPHSQQWLAVSQLTPERLLPLLKPLPEPTTPVVHLYHCDHLGTPIALINTQGGIDWRAEFDP
jgi:YD repeat-containing protein